MSHFNRFVSRDTLGTRATGLKSMVYTYVSKRKLLIWNEFGVITSKIPRSEGRNPELHMLVRSILKFSYIFKKLQRNLFLMNKLTIQF
jgi:hypothetical protein